MATEPGDRCRRPRARAARRVGAPRRVDPAEDRDRCPWSRPRDRRGRRGLRRQARADGDAGYRRQHRRRPSRSRSSERARGRSTPRRGSWTWTPKGSTSRSSTPRSAWASGGSPIRTRRCRSRVRTTTGSRSTARSRPTGTAARPWCRSSHPTDAVRELRRAPRGARVRRRLRPPEPVSRTLDRRRGLRAVLGRRRGARDGHRRARGLPTRGAPVGLGPPAEQLPRDARGLAHLRADVRVRAVDRRGRPRAPSGSARRVPRSGRRLGALLAGATRPPGRLVRGLRTAHAPDSERVLRRASAGCRSRSTRRRFPRSCRSSVPTGSCGARTTPTPTRRFRARSTSCAPRSRRCPPRSRSASSCANAADLYAL